MTMPTVTVVIPTAGRVALTRACIESIQTASADDGVEVEIFVVDSSITQDQTKLQAICTQLGAILIPGPSSVSEKRNLGAEQARADHVMFIDSDCAVGRGCLVAHLSTLQTPSAHASQGTILFRGPERLPFRAVRCSGLLSAFLPSRGQMVRSAASGNLMVKRDAFLQVRFDPRLGPPGLGGEDVDFGLRLAAHDFCIIGTPSAVVYHETVTWNGLLANARRFFSWGRSEAHLIDRHRVASYLDMPPAALVALMLGMASMAAAAWSWRALLAFPAGGLAYAVSMSVAGTQHHPEDRLGGALGHWVFFALDLGRIAESFRRFRPDIALRRLRFADDQITQEWRDLVTTARAVWLMVLVAIVVLWWAVR